MFMFEIYTARTYERKCVMVDEKKNIYKKYL